MAATKGAFQGRLALITGGSSGIGLALARLLAARGANVWLLARRPGLLEAALKSLPVLNGQKHGMLQVDVSDWGQVQSAVERLQREAGVPDLLFNCAGIIYPGYADEIPVERYREVMDIDFFGTLHMVKAVLPGMLARGTGHIVNVSSVAGFVTGPGYGAYSGAKYAVRGFSDVLRAELKPKGLKVSVVFPPDTDTPQLAYQKEHNSPELQQVSDDASIGPIRFGVHRPEEVAAAILDAVQRGTYVILPGKANSLLYHMVGLLGNLVYPITDDEWTQARRKTKSTEKGSHGSIRESVQLHGREGSDQGGLVPVLHPDDGERGNGSGLQGPPPDHVRLEQLSGADDRSKSASRRD